MHAGTLVVRPLTVLGATLQIAKYDGSTAVWTSVKNVERTKVSLCKMSFYFGFALLSV